MGDYSPCSAPCIFNAPMPSCPASPADKACRKNSCAELGRITSIEMFCWMHTSVSTSKHLTLHLFKKTSVVKRVTQANSDENILGLVPQTQLWTRGTYAFPDATRSFRKCTRPGKHRWVAWNHMRLVFPLRMPCRA